MGHPGAGNLTILASADRLEDGGRRTGGRPAAGTGDMACLIRPQRACRDEASLGMNPVLRPDCLLLFPFLGGNTRLILDGSCIDNLHTRNLSFCGRRRLSRWIYVAKRKSEPAGQVFSPRQANGFALRIPRIFWRGIVISRGKRRASRVAACSIVPWQHDRRRDPAPIRERWILVPGVAGGESVAVTQLFLAVCDERSSCSE